MNSVLPVCHSSFSLLYGTTPPEEIVLTASRKGYHAIALADRDNLYGCYDFYYAALEAGIRPIIGARLTTMYGQLILICQNHDGFKNLSRLVTDYQLNGKPSSEILHSYRANIICLSDMQPNADELAEIYKDNFYINIGGRGASAHYYQTLKAGLKPAASPPVGFLKKDHYETHRLLRAIEGGYLLSNLPVSSHASREEYLKETNRYDKFFRDYPAAITGTREIIEKANIVFPERKNILPDVRIDGNHFEKLRADVISGLRKKIPRPSGRYLSRLEYELSVIRRTGFVDYFLIVGEILNYCRRNDIAAVGRGSAAGSLVSYSLGITEVDPIEENLYFERFLNEARSDCPDIDLDIDWRRRDDVIDHIYDKYGREHVAMIATYTRFQPRLAARETAKARGIPPEEISRFVKMLPRINLGQLSLDEKLIPAQSRQKLDWEKFMPVLQDARKLAGLPRHLSIHAGGIVITPQPLTDYVPLERATKGITVTQCDMYQAEKIGLVKIDILGQRGLAVIADCQKAVSNIKGRNFTIPEKDEKTYGLLKSGKTIGVFQIESPGLRALLRDIQPTGPADITLALALIRPGASESGMKKIFLKRFHNLEKTEYPNPGLEEILKETFGVFIYQEQVILAAQKIAGFNLPASDILRRAITKKRLKGENLKLKKRFIDGARKNGINDTAIQSIYKQLGQFARFGFCKAHAATYGCLAYQSAYYKAHYPDLFMTAVLRNGGGYYPAVVYVSEARRLGVPVMPPDVNLSKSNDSLHGGKIYIGLGRIKDIEQKTIEQIEQLRPFGSLSDFLSRVKISDAEIKQLIRIGSFGSLEISRAKLFWQYRLAGHHDHWGKNDIFGGQVVIPGMKPMPQLQDFSRYEIFRAENEILRLNASFHPLTLFNNYRNTNPDDIYRMPDNSPVTLSGWRADIKRIKTKNGDWMIFITFDTLDDNFEVILFPDTYNRCSETVRNNRYLCIEGVTNHQDGRPAIVARRIYPAPTGIKEARRI